MVCLLVSVTVLHLVTLAMLLISTLEKVGHACTTTCRVSCFLTVGVTVCSPGGCGPTRRSPTSGTTVSTTTPPTPGCVLLPVKVVNEQSRDSDPVRSGPVRSVCVCLLTAACPCPSDWLQSVQALMVLSVVFSSISFLVFMMQLFTLSTGGLFYFTGLCQGFAGILEDSSSEHHLCVEITFVKIKKPINTCCVEQSGRYLKICFFLHLKA